MAKTILSALAIIVALGFVLTMMRGPEDPSVHLVKAYLAALRAGDVGAVRSMLGGRESFNFNRACGPNDAAQCKKELRRLMPKVGDYKVIIAEVSEIDPMTGRRMIHAIELDGDKPLTDAWYVTKLDGETWSIVEQQLLRYNPEIFTPTGIVGMGKGRLDLWVNYRKEKSSSEQVKATPAHATATPATGS